VDGEHLTIQIHIPSEDMSHKDKKKAVNSKNSKSIFIGITKGINNKGNALANWSGASSAITAKGEGLKKPMMWFMYLPKKVNSMTKSVICKFIQINTNPNKKKTEDMIT